MIENSHTNNYALPVSQLLTYGKAEVVEADQWPDYQALGLGSEQIPELIRMATDPALLSLGAGTVASDNAENLTAWAPAHAVRALGQLNAVEAVEPLLSILKIAKSDDWIEDELPEAIGMIGPDALPALRKALSTVPSATQYQVNVTNCIMSIAVGWPESLPACVELMTHALENFAENDPEFNGFLILELTELNARSALPLMEQAFASDRVETMLTGTWDEIQADFGLISSEELAERLNTDEDEYVDSYASPLPAMTPDMFRIVPLSITQGPSPEKRQNELKRQKNKKQMAKQSKKKNRKR